MGKRKVKKNDKQKNAAHVAQHAKTSKDVPLNVQDEIISLFSNKKYHEIIIKSRSLLEQCPESAFLWKALGVAQFQLGDLPSSLESLHRSLEQFPDDFQVCNNIGLVYEKRGESENAIRFFKQATLVNPRFCEAYNNCANSHANIGDREGAERYYKEALKCNQNYVEALNNYGVLLSDLKRYDESLQCYAKALSLDAGFAYALNNTGNLMKKMHRYDEAMKYYKKAVQANPRYFEAFNNIANLMKDRGLLEESLAYYSKAVEIEPRFAAAYNNMGAAYFDMNMIDKAFSCYQLALSIDPNVASVYKNLSVAFRLNGQLLHAYDCCNKIIELDKNDALALQIAATLEGHMSAYDDVVIKSNKALSLDYDNDTLWDQRLYIYSYHPDLPENEIYHEFLRWGNRFVHKVKPFDFSSHGRDANRKLKIGYVSPDFRRHTSRFYFEPLFSNHDKLSFELYAYSNVKIQDEYTDTFKSYFDHWRNIRGMTADEAAELIYNDKIDILVDGCNHMADDRLDIFAIKPAPIQATWLGAAWTTGLRSVDYVFFDPYIAPEGTLTSEEIVRLPDCFVAYRPPNGTPDVAELPSLTNGYVTFGYTGRSERLNYKVFTAWSDILRQLPNAKLILDFRVFADEKMQFYYKNMLHNYGIDADRVLMRCSSNIFSALGEIDILLDCFPHSGGTMLFDALWMGVPALTLSSRPPVGRIGTTIMHNLGLPQWIAASQNEYVEKAISFANDTEYLRDLRASLRQQLIKSPIMNEKAFSLSFEKAYREMWRIWCSNEQPRAFTVSL